MQRRQVLGTFAALAACAIARPARGAGLLRFRNRSFAGGVTVQVRVGDELESAPLYGSRRIAKGEDWEVDADGALAWWRRELNPGKDDGQFTAWTRVDPRRADTSVEL